jgi:hypothetical protein
MRCVDNSRLQKEGAVNGYKFRPFDGAVLSVLEKRVSPAK